ncbi:MAG TPA: Gfo/Idh/MocA family oxidoreductase [Gemmatimonadales bacterium]|nr:Gfo/Idh/MocA family oxidoreductase [Gemmatimonadales bacterium]
MRPRVGFLGVGWIGRNRLEALARSNVAEIVAVADPSPENARAASTVGRCSTMGSLEELLALGLDGLAIATPSALHAEQACTALDRGAAVFCQKPLGRTAVETSEVVDTARRRNRLLGVDLSYRFVEGARRIRHLVQAGELGSIYAADLTFHNAYGPDKSWFYDPALSGGGCVIDLGIHLVDLALWVLEDMSVTGVSSHLFASGKPLTGSASQVEDFALAELELSSGAVVRLACSWNLPAGCDAVIEAAFFGEAGGAMLSNVNGSFYDFTADRFRGTARERLSSPPDDWGGRAIVDWATRLSTGAGYDPSAEQLVEVAAVLDAIYGRGTQSGLTLTAQAAAGLAQAGVP